MSDTTEAELQRIKDDMRDGTIPVSTAVRRAVEIARTSLRQSVTVEHKATSDDRTTFCDDAPAVVDEIVMTGADVHIERLSDTAYFLQIGERRFSVLAVGRKVEIREDE